MNKKAAYIAIIFFVLALIISYFMNSEPEQIDWKQFICNETDGMAFEREFTPEKVREELLEEWIIAGDIEVKMITTPARLEEYRQEELNRIKAYMEE